MNSSITLVIKKHRDGELMMPEIVKQCHHLIRQSGKMKAIQVIRSVLSIGEVKRSLLFFIILVCAMTVVIALGTKSKSGAHPEPGHAKKTSWSMTSLNNVNQPV